MRGATSCAASTRSAALAADSEREYELILTPPARRALTERLSEAVAAAVMNFLTSTLVSEPRRVGKPLRGTWLGSGRPAAAAIECSTDCARINARSSCYESTTAAMFTGRCELCAPLKTSCGRRVSGAAAGGRSSAGTAGLRLSL